MKPKRSLFLAGALTGLFALSVYSPAQEAPKLQKKKLATTQGAELKGAAKGATLKTGSVKESLSRSKFVADADKFKGYYQLDAKVINGHLYLFIIKRNALKAEYMNYCDAVVFNSDPSEVFGKNIGDFIKSKRKFPPAPGKSVMVLTKGEFNNCRLFKGLPPVKDMCNSADLGKGQTGGGSFLSGPGGSAIKGLSSIGSGGSSGLGRGGSAGTGRDLTGGMGGNLGSSGMERVGGATGLGGGGLGRGSDRFGGLMSGSGLSASSNLNLTDPCSNQNCTSSQSSSGQGGLTGAGNGGGSDQHSVVYSGTVDTGGSESYVSGGGGSRGSDSGGLGHGDSRMMDGATDSGGFRMESNTAMVDVSYTIDLDKGTAKVTVKGVIASRGGSPAPEMGSTSATYDLNDPEQGNEFAKIQNAAKEAEYGPNPPTNGTDTGSGTGSGSGSGGTGTGGGSGTGSGSGSGGTGTGGGSGTGSGSGGSGGGEYPACDIPGSGNGCGGEFTYAIDLTAEQAKQAQGAKKGQVSQPAPDDQAFGAPGSVPNMDPMTPYVNPDPNDQGGLALTTDATVCQANKASQQYKSGLGGASKIKGFATDCPQDNPDCKPNIDTPGGGKPGCKPGSPSCGD